ncbi:expressed unknown protein [Seminavis robusta]|uniref:Uncharacterized protein n=1 Tax=Seminavis robusta TaxID=568900 RepID=A0A9N8H3Q9_9STRA|nr:expressed unknown protein [Seminavis robusta]|eukprot:Sro44_g026551.1  (103) ;mRNA; f:39789-40097
MTRLLVLLAQSLERISKSTKVCMVASNNQDFLAPPIIHLTVWLGWYQAVVGRLQQMHTEGGNLSASLTDSQSDTLVLLHQIANDDNIDEKDVGFTLCPALPQ